MTNQNLLQTDKQVDGSLDDVNRIQIGDYSLDLNEIRYDFKSLLSSSNPFELHSKIGVIKGKFSVFLNNIANEVVDIFSLDNSRYSISDLYYRSKYHFVILKGLEEYIYDSKYFDLRFYFGSAISLDKDKQFLAKILLKLYLGVKDDEINKFLIKYKAKKWCLDSAKKIFNQLEISKIQITDQKYLSENDIHLFLERIYLSLDSTQKQLFMNNFLLGKYNGEFRDINRLFAYIVGFYLRQDYEISGKTKIILDYVNNPENAEVKKIIDGYLNNYQTNKLQFYDKIIEALNSFDVDKGYFWAYVKTSLIDKYFPKLKQIFYWNMVSGFVSDRLVWNSLSGSLAFNKYNTSNIQEPTESESPKINKDMVYKLMRMLELKSMIIDMENNISWSFIKPIVYNQIIEHLKIDRKSFDKLQFILCFILAKDYYEYRLLYNFFYEIKVIYGLDYKTNNSLYNMVDKLKISFSLILASGIGMVVLFFIAPFVFWLSIMLLSILYLVDYFKDSNYYKIRWNAGLKAFAYIACIITGFTWIINLGKSLESSQQIVQQFNSINQLTAYQAFQKIDSNGVKHYVDILMGGK